MQFLVRNRTQPCRAHDPGNVVHSSVHGREPERSHSSEEEASGLGFQRPPLLKGTGTLRQQRARKLHPLSWWSRLIHDLATKFEEVRR
jgi:hypothetical protein